MTAAPRQDALAVVVVAPGTGSERVVAVHDRLSVGRECAGVDDAHRLLLDDAAISRSHLEISLEPEAGRASFIDHSLNGTLLNGGRVERAVPVPIGHGDRLRVGPVDLEFRSKRFVHHRPGRDGGDTAARSSRGSSRGSSGGSSGGPSNGLAILVVGDVVDYAAVAERSGRAAANAALRGHFGEIRRLLLAHRGRVGNSDGGAFLAVWEHADADAATDAVTFALAASRFSRGPSARRADGSSIEMGWAVVRGEAAVTVLGDGAVTAVGEGTNAAFRIAALAGRDDRATVLATASIGRALGDRLVTDPPLGLALSDGALSEAVQPVYAVRADPAAARPGG